jgi:hypothetical protein
MKIETFEDSLLKQLARRRPTILLLGQSYLDATGRENGFLKSIAAHFKFDPTKSEPLLDQLNEFLGDGDLSGNLRYLHHRSETTPISQDLDTISNFAWSSVFTSTIDEVWVRAFKKPWRSLNTVFTEDSWPLEARDHNHLCSTFLFGCVDKEDQDSRIPAGSFKLDERAQIAVSLLRRLPEVTTPMGVVLIEGYNPEIDWLKAKELYPVFNALADSQVFLFSASQEVRANKYMAKLHEDGKLRFLDLSLASFLRRAVDEGVISFGDPAVKLSVGRQITINSAPHVIPKDLWQNLSGIVSILDDNVLVPSASASSDQEYAAYRNFLADPVKSNDWSGFANGYAFQRDFQAQLRSECERRLKQNRIQSNPLVLHGESGTGKTVALANMAYRIASECTYPTLFIDRSVSNPDWRPIDRFFNWAEDCGAPGCLLVWDGMRTDESYSNLQRRLADRGRKALLVGSSYLSTDGSDDYIEAPRELNLNEKARFKEYLARFVPEFAESLGASTLPIDPEFLVALYRILPAARPKLVKGITGELDYAGKQIIEKIKEAEAQKTSFNSLEFAFQQIPFLHASSNEVAEEALPSEGRVSKEVRELIALVMVPGKYGYRVPIELLLSALGRNINSATIAALQTGILTWTEQNNGDILVGPRHPLEAKMYVDSFYGGAAEAEAEFICKLMMGLKKGPSARANTDFIVDLLRYVGPNSPIERNKSHFKYCILTFADALKRLRMEKSVVSPRLMLQEAAFFREGAKSQLVEHSIDERMKLFEHARDVLLAAKELTDCPEGLKSTISADLAACYGGMIQSAEDKGGGKIEIAGLYDHARDALREAMRRSWANAYAVVTLGWISRTMLDSTSITDFERSEIQAELLFRFDEADPSTFEAGQIEHFLKEKLRVMSALKNQTLAEDAFEALKRAGSKAGYFLRARSLFEGFPDSNPTADELGNMRRAEAYLDEVWKEVVSDERCLGLYLNLWWFVRVGQPRFAAERKILPFTESEWIKLADVTEAFASLQQPEPPAWLRFLKALAAFHCGNIGNSIREFREMSSDIHLQAGGNRLKKYFVASFGGAARTYDGIVRSRVEEDRFGEVWVNQLHHAIPIVPRDFDKRELRQGESVADFNIAFSYTGPIAQPPRFLRPKTAMK